MGDRHDRALPGGAGQGWVGVKAGAHSRSESLEPRSHLWSLPPGIPGSDSSDSLSQRPGVHALLENSLHLTQERVAASVSEQIRQGPLFSGSCSFSDCKAIPVKTNVAHPSQRFLLRPTSVSVPS